MLNAVPPVATVYVNIKLKYFDYKRRGKGFGLLPRRVFSIYRAIRFSAIAAQGFGSNALKFTGVPYRPTPEQILTLVA